jgi:hypothetical protein
MSTWDETCVGGSRLVLFVALIAARQERPTIPPTGGRPRDMGFCRSRPPNGCKPLDDDLNCRGA